MRRPALTALCLVPVLLWLSPVSAADMSSFVGEPSAWQQAVAWILDQQRLFHRELAGDLRALQAGGSAAATWTLVVVSFLYGVFHAAGPGHGKAVIATYLLTHESRLGRGLWLAAASSLCQGMVAVLLVSGLVAVAGWLPHDTQSAVLWSERFSFVLLAGLGMVFALRAARDLVLVFRRPDGHHHHDHHGDHHEHGPSCGCSHGPTPQQIEQAHTLRGTVGVLLSVGLRPCSGAVLVLALANVLGLVWAGIAAVAAMSVGTAITVAVLALMTVKARHWAGAFFGGASRPRWAGRLVALAGGTAIFCLGVSLLLGSFGPAHPLRL